MNIGEIVLEIEAIRADERELAQTAEPSVAQEVTSTEEASPEPALNR